NQLTDFARGALNSSNDAILGTANHSQSWHLDSMGNWNSLTSDGNTQARTHNQQNQIASISGATGPSYDNNGNTTVDQYGNVLLYDAWNRLLQVTVQGRGGPVTYSYDARSRRVPTTANGGTPTDLYYSRAWQVVEERTSSAVEAQYVWSPVYVDAMVERDHDG